MPYKRAIIKIQYHKVVDVSAVGGFRKYWDILRDGEVYQQVHSLAQAKEVERKLNMREDENARNYARTFGTA